MEHSSVRFRKGWIFALAAVAVIAGIVLIALLTPGRGHAAPAQEAEPTPVTIPYSHKVHVQEVGVQCMFCHTKALRSPQADIPSLNKCMVCHNYVSVDDPDAQAQIDQLKAAYESGARVQWPDVYKQPDFVRFDHSAHVRNDVACETCHGDVANMDLVEKAVDLNMGFCVSCHRDQVDQGTDASEVAASVSITGSITGTVAGEVRAITVPHSSVDMPRLLDCSTCHK